MVQKQYQDAAVTATSGMRINTLSDDPSVLTRLFSLRNQSQNIDQYQSNSTQIRTRLQYMDSRLEQSADVLNRVRETVLRANDPTVPPDQRILMGQQIDDMKTEFLNYANSQLDERYVFAGTATATQPFSGTPTTFNANTNDQPVKLADSIQMNMTMNSNDLFMGSHTTAVGASLATSLYDSNSAPLNLVAGDIITIAGSVGGTAISGQTLTVTSTTTLANIATAIQTALRSVADGTLTETAAVQGDGSILVSADASNAITNLTLTASGRTDFNNAFTFSTSIAAGGTGSSDTFDTGTGEDIFDLFDDASLAVQSGDPDDIESAIKRLDHALTQMNNGRGTLGTRIQQLNSIDTAQGDDLVRFSSDLSQLQEASLDQALSNLVTRETALRLVFASTSKILSTSSSLQLNI